MAAVALTARPCKFSFGLGLLGNANCLDSPKISAQALGVGGIYFTYEILQEV